MRQFAQKGLRIDQLSVEAKLLYTAFCLMALAALAVSILYYVALVGTEPVAGVRAYYAGEAGPVTPVGDTAIQQDGPIIELDEPEETAPGPIVVSVTKRKLLEVTHFHLFTVPVFLLIIGHLFMMCRVRPTVRIAVVASAVVATMLHLIAPWIIFWGGGGWAWLMPVTGTAMTATMVAMCGWPIIAMWRQPPQTSSAAA